MQRRAELFEAPGMPEDILFALKDITYTPETPRMDEPFIVKGKVDLFKIPFLAPLWVIATVTAPETWWEHYIPIWGAPQVREMVMATGGDFEVTFPKGFDREGEYSLATRLYAGPTMPIDKMVIPPFPPMATDETTFIVLGEVPPEEIGFSLTKPSVSPTATPEPGTDITISCPVTSECTEEQDIRVKCIIYEGSILPGHGTKLKEFTSDITPIPPGETKTFEFSRRTVTGTIDRRDVEVEVWIGGELIKQSEWDDVYYVGRPPEEVIDFDLARPSVSPAEVTPGIDITITCPITSACTKQQTVTAKVIIYEGSILPGHGSRIVTRTSSPFTILPGQSYNIEVSHTAIAGTIDRRDVEVEVYIAGKLVKENEWDDVYYVERLPEPPTSDIRNFDFKAVGGTYDLGDTVGYEAPYDYKGKAQSGWLTISLGTGVYPSFFTKHTFSRIRVSFDEAMDWTSGYLSGHFTLPTTLELGQTYSVRAKLETDDGKQETDTDWGVITIKEEAPPVYEPPRITTRPATNITHNSATLWGQLIDTGYWNVVDCRFEWGKTTAYGHMTSKARMYEGNEGDEIQAELTGLDMDTTYHYRAYAVTVGIDGELKGYGDDRTFTTEKEVVKGFTFRVRNARAGSTSWWAAYVAGGQRAHMPVEQPLSYVWEWRPYPQYIPATKEDFFVTSLDSAMHTTQYDEFPVKLREGKDYIWDFSAHELLEDGTVIIRTA